LPFSCVIAPKQPRWAPYTTDELFPANGVNKAVTGSALAFLIELMAV
jgi:hypothetical protein